MSIGVLAHLFGRLPYRELAAKARLYGFQHVQLALWKAVSDVDFSQKGKLSPGLAMSIAEAFDKEKVHISVLGCYLHFFDRDEAVRRNNVERCKELLRYARLMGAPMVAFETGSLPDRDYTEADWQVMKRVLEELAEEAERWGVFIGLEAANGHLIGTAEQLHAMLEEVPTSQIGVVLDPGNLLHEGNIARQEAVIEEAFRLLGGRIIACHAKDRLLQPDGNVITKPAGLGQMDYNLYMKLLQQYKPEVHIIMEEAAEEQMASCKSFIEQIRNQYSVL
ncbi:sugar phosphate isomerase/epimerase family protein [Paenibacillus protaetiae]|uniref:Sugar phosphate isomerase/epimerase n=1 Tax=Paenibacillus protaetiae TaxID=2509456 RepID=A0A4P6F0B7_9BACL|nr:sugar phosphate isomerase/epimerase [Paenibacillus protaetiae]QAY68033.1 sugar phosphate isomerase/epimerase [Paenibacillus protaetiae]